MAAEHAADRIHGTSGANDATSSRDALTPVPAGPSRCSSRGLGLPAGSMNGVLERFRGLCERRGERALICSGSMFRVHSRVARPIGPIAMNCSPTARELREIVRALDAYMVWWTWGDDNAHESDWYAVICDRFTPIEEMPAKRRSEFRRGLKNCEVRQLDAEFVSRHAYAVYAKAYTRYRGEVVVPWNEEQFRWYFSQATGFEDIANFWGAFHEGQLIAWAAVHVYGKVEATYWAMKLDPDFLYLYPAYALLHTLNEFYLVQKGMRYVNDGWRSILHQTEMQDFLVRKFGFVRHHRWLRAHYRPPLNLLINAVYPLADRLARLDERLAAVFTLEQLNRAARQRERVRRLEHGLNHTSAPDSA